MIRYILLLLFALLTGKPQIIFGQTTSFAHISVAHGLSNKGVFSKDQAFHISFNVFTGATGSVKGFQLGSLYNDNRNEFQGLQLSGLINRGGHTVNGLQLGGLSNFCSNLKGMQLSGLTNHMTHGQGIQIAGLVNTASHLHGLQVSGIFNHADTLKGFQLGLINIADTVVQGVPFGLISIIRKGGYWALEAGDADYQQVSLQYRVGLPALYTIIGAGYNLQPDALLSSSIGIGQRYLDRKWGQLRNELHFVSYIDTDLRKGSGPFALHFQTGINIHLGPHFYLNLQPSLALTTWDQEDLDHNWQTSFIQPFKTWESVEKRRTLSGGLKIGLGFSNL